MSFSHFSGEQTDCHVTAIGRWSPSLADVRACASGLAPVGVFAARPHPGTAASLSSLHGSLLCVSVANPSSQPSLRLAAKCWLSQSLQLLSSQIHPPRSCSETIMVSIKLTILRNVHDSQWDRQGQKNESC